MLKPVKVIDAYCEKHDKKYKANVYHVFNHESVQPCPRCHIENTRAMAVASQVEQARIVISAREKRERDEWQAKQLKTSIPELYQTRFFSNYRVESKAQQSALDICREFADNFSAYRRSGGTLVLAGTPGTGKTHLSCSIANQIIQQDYTAVFITVVEMVRKIHSTYGTSEGEQEVIDRFSNVDFLILDEVGKQSGSLSEQNLVSEVIANRVNHHRPNVLLSNLELEKMKETLGERAWDRLTEGRSTLVDFNWESYRSRVSGDKKLQQRPA
ncbi:hypothetical protein A9Q81_11820 [Gammaproteobacteria bacterium 42_54_T18]|nr:hypothetical protein A9Q81_11820 [Gammaproteobacteria bacterium 42_54_T18]